MKGRQTKRAPSADLLVCFPSRAHLTLMPKPICSPARPSETSKPTRTKSSTRGVGSRARPLLWAKPRQMGSELSEPTSPKVTCAGQIKVRHKASSCKNWQSVMEEIERIHNSRKHVKKPAWIDSFGFKKDIMHFLTCLRNIRFDFRCFGSFPAQSDITSDDDEDDEECEAYQENHVGVEGKGDNEDSRTISSKWFMMLQENQKSTTGLLEEEIKQKQRSRSDESLAAPSVPPPNALMLMRCRSAPAKSWQEEEDEEEEEEEEYEEEDEEEEEEKKGKSLKALMEEERRNSKTEKVVVMGYDTDFYKLSTDIAKETWVVGGMRDPLSRSRSWKR
ncbi:myotubularin-related protein [Salix suchowensis]|nr:myotubularin-related protein [Salix suchowensis]